MENAHPSILLYYFQKNEIKCLFLMSVWLETKKFHEIYFQEIYLETKKFLFSNFYVDNNEYMNRLI